MSTISDSEWDALSDVKSDGSTLSDLEDDITSEPSNDKTVSIRNLEAQNDQFRSQISVYEGRIHIEESFRHKILSQKNDLQHRLACKNREFTELERSTDAKFTAAKAKLDNQEASHKANLENTVREKDEQYAKIEAELHESRVSYRKACLDHDKTVRAKTKEINELREQNDVHVFQFNERIEAYRTEQVRMRKTFEWRLNNTTKAMEEYRQEALNELTVQKKLQAKLVMVKQQCANQQRVQLEAQNRIAELTQKSMEQESTLQATKNYIAKVNMRQQMLYGQEIQRVSDNYEAARKNYAREIECLANEKAKLKASYEEINEEKMIRGAIIGRLRAKLDAATVKYSDLDLLVNMTGTSKEVLNKLINPYRPRNTAQWSSSREALEVAKDKASCPSTTGGTKATTTVPIDELTNLKEMVSKFVIKQKTRKESGPDNPAESNGNTEEDASDEHCQCLYECECQSRTRSDTQNDDGSASKDGGNEEDQEDDQAKEEEVPDMIDAPAPQMSQSANAIIERQSEAIDIIRPVPGGWY